jgi:tol-pal system protein YbgF
MLVAPPAQALNDDVAVQLLERLNDLEGEVSSLRTENESLKDKLDGSPTREEDEQQVAAEADQASTDANANLDEQAKTAESYTNAEPQIPGVNIIVEDAATASSDSADIPSLEQEASVTEATATTEATQNPATEVPAETQFLTTTTADSAPALLNAGAATVATEATPATSEVTPAPVEQTSPDAATATPVVSAPVTAPVVSIENTATTATTSTSTTATSSAATTTTSSTEATPVVDPKSKDSYYYYGTAEAEKTTELKPAAAAVPAASSPAPAAAPMNADGRKAKADYNQAYQLLVSKPAEAAPLFRTFLANYPQHELAANAQYWLAEALYAQKDFEGASQEFMKVLKQYKDSPKSSGAALKLGYSFYELKQWEYARRTLEDTVRFFPDSSSAKLAEARLQKMKDEGH